MHETSILKSDTPLKKLRYVYIYIYIIPFVPKTLSSLMMLFLFGYGEKKLSKLIISPFGPRWAHLNGTSKVLQMAPPEF